MFETEKTISPSTATAPAATSATAVAEPGTLLANASLSAHGVERANSLTNLPRNELLTAITTATDWQTVVQGLKALGPVQSNEEAKVVLKLLEVERTPSIGSMANAMLNSVFGDGSLWASTFPKRFDCGPKIFSGRELSGGDFSQLPVLKDIPFQAHPLMHDVLGAAADSLRGREDSQLALTRAAVALYSEASFRSFKPEFDNKWPAIAKLVEAAYPGSVTIENYRDSVTYEAGRTGKTTNTAWYDTAFIKLDPKGEIPKAPEGLDSREKNRFGAMLASLQVKDSQRGDYRGENIPFLDSIYGT